MPIYEFYCHKCDLKYEEFHEIGAYDSFCPDCGEFARHILSPVYSNFSAWSETLDRKGKWATTPEDFSECEGS